jgi:hypothetical protein
MLPRDSKFCLWGNFMTDRYKKERAARRSVAGIPAEIADLGGTPAHGAAMANAMRHVLRGRFSEAERALTGTYSADAVRKFMPILKNGLAPAHS